jgi:hypothetical protein
MTETKQHLEEFNQATDAIKVLTAQLLEQWALAHLENKEPKSYQERVMKGLVKK